MILCENVPVVTSIKCPNMKLVISFMSERRFKNIREELLTEGITFTLFLCVGLGKTACGSFAYNGS